MKRLFCVLLLTYYIKSSKLQPTSTNPSLVPVDAHNIEHIRVHNKTEENPIKENQNVEGKEIIDNEEPGYDYPVVTKKEADHESGRIDFDQLRQKCMHFTKLLNLVNSRSTSKPPNYEQSQDDYRPVYVTTHKPTVKPTYPSVTARPSSFYITVPPGNNRISIPAASAIRYIRLEPVILQKTILSNGRTVYYWHKSLPTAVEYPKTENVGRDEPYQSSYNYGYNPFYNYYYNPNMYVPPTGTYYNPPYQTPPGAKPTETTTEQSTTTTTEESSFSYGLSHLIPFYGSGSGDSTSSTTTETPTTTPSKLEDLLYAQQLKFVVPVPYDDNIRQSWGYNPYNYNPQAIPQASNNFRGPYGPQLQIVKAMVVPKVEGKGDDKDEEVNK